MRCLASLVRLIQILAILWIGQNQLSDVPTPIPERYVQHIVAILVRRRHLTAVVQQFTHNARALALHRQ